MQTIIFKLKILIILFFTISINSLNADTLESYKNKWKQTNLTVSGNSQWIVKKSTFYNGYTICKKSNKQECLNIQHGNLQSSTIENSWKSAVWDFKPAGSEYVHIQNKWKENIYLHLENTNVEAGEIESGWYSAMWKRTIKTIVTPPSTTSLSKRLGSRYEQPSCKEQVTDPIASINILKENEIIYNGVKSWAIEMEADVRGGSSSCTDSRGIFRTQDIFVTWETDKGGFLDITGYSSETKYNRVRFIVPIADKLNYDVRLYVGDNLGKEIVKVYSKLNGEDYIKKGTEIPIESTLYHIGNETPNSSIEIFWKQIKDSKKNDNVNYYELEVATNRSFSNSKITNVGNNVNNGTASYNFSGLKDNTTAYFRVRGVNGVGRGAWSNVQSIVVKMQDKPIFSSQPKFPLMNASDISKQTPFKWNCSDADNDTLEFIVSLGESSDKLYYDTGWISPSASNNLYEIGYDAFRRTKLLKPNTKYYWQVMVREKGKNADYYGGAYTKTPIWNFTTQSTGSDLVINFAKAMGKIKPNGEVVFRIDVKNIGTETARPERIEAFYKKDEKTTKFWKGSTYMTDSLKAGETQMLNITIKFRDDIFEKNGETYDNVLVTGDSFVIFDFQNISEQDVNIYNNKKEFKIHYGSTGKPEFTEFYLMSSYLFENKKDFIRGIIGEVLDIGYRVKDDIKVTKIITEYRLNPSDSWKEIQVDTNNDDYADANIKWNIPNDKSHVTDTAEIRIRAYENATSYTEKSFVFPIYSNTLDLKNISFDKDSYIVGDEVTITYDLDNDYDIRSFRIDLENPDTGDRIKVLRENYEANKQPIGTIKFTIPDDNKYAGDKSYLNITMYDVHELKFLKEVPFPEIKVNGSLPSPFNKIIEVYKPLNTNVPSNAESYGRGSYNRIEKTIIDENNVVHMIVASVAEYMISHDSFSNIDYLYITYDYNSKKLSSALKIVSATKDNPMRFKDFTLVNDKPFLLLNKIEGTNVHSYLSYKSGSKFTSTQEVLNKSTVMWNEVDFANYNNKLYIKWVDTENGTKSINRRNKQKEVYPNKGVEKNIHDTYLGYEVRVNNGHLYADCGKIFSLNNDLTINKSLFKSEDNSCTPMGEFKDFSTTHEVIDFFSVAFGDTRTKLIKKDFSILLLESKKDNSEVAIYNNKTITVGYLNDKNSITVYDSKFKKISEISFGKYTEFEDVYAKSDINKNQIMAVSNIERYKAYLTVGDLSTIVAPLDTDGDGIPDDIDPDDDNDGMSDKDEIKYGLNPLVNDANDDEDSDGISNIDEINAGLDPTNKDSDSDGVDDREDKYPLDPTKSSDIKIVDIKDKKLLECVRSSLKLSKNATPTTEQLLGLKKLVCRNKKMTNENIKEIGKMPNLEYVYLDRNKITDVSILSKLKNLEYIHLGSTPITNNIDIFSELVNLKYLYLHKTKVVGDIASLSNLNKMKRVYLYGTKVLGDIEALSNMTAVQYIHFSGLKVSGDLSALSNLKKLRYLNLYKSNVSGDISELENLINLQYLYLHRSKQVKGDISSLSDLNKIRRVYLYGTKVLGDIEALSNMTAVQYIHFSGLKVSGDLSALSNLKKLRYLNLYKSNVSGDISELEKLINLQYLYLHRSKQVKGDISSLSDLNKMRRVYLYGTKVVGDIEALSNMTAVQYIHFSGLKVSGDLSALQNLKKLRYLNLYKSNVSGDISKLKNLINLQYLYLHRSKQVEGDISSLSKLVKLKRLYLYNTNVEGDIVALSSLKQAQYIHLGNTKVSGNKSSLLNSLPKLKKLYINNTNVN